MKIALENKTAGSGGDIKLYETAEELQNVTGMKDGDIAVVGNDYRDVNINDWFEYIYFPDTVTLNETMTSFAYVCFLDDNGYQKVTVNWWYGNEFTIDVKVTMSGQNDITITYSSQDGLVFTRLTELSENPIHFDYRLHYCKGWSGNSADLSGYNKFIQVPDKKTMYRYSTHIDTQNVNLITGLSSNGTYTNSMVKNISNIMNIFNDSVGVGRDVNFNLKEKECAGYLVYNSSNNEFIIYTTTYICNVLVNGNNNSIDGNTTSILRKFTIDETTKRAASSSVTLPISLNGLYFTPILYVNGKFIPSTVIPYKLSGSSSTYSGEISIANFVTNWEKIN